MILHDRKIVFIHNPRCAGRSMEVWLNDAPENDPHRRGIKQLREIERGQYAEYFKFTIVRNPYVKITSAFSHYVGGGNKTKEDVIIGKRLQPMGVDAFVESLADLSALSLPHFDEIRYLIMPQHVYVSDKLTIYNLEKIDQVIEELSERFGITKPFPHFHPDQGEYKLSEASRRIIRSIYKRDFELLGYDPSV